MLWGAWWKSNRKITQFGECVCVWCVDMFPLNDTCTNLWGTLEYSVNCKDKACGWLLIFKSGIHSGGADNQLFPKNLQKMVCIKHSISIISPIKNNKFVPCGPHRSPTIQPLMLLCVITYQPLKNLCSSLRW